MDDDILDIMLLPKWDSPSIRSALEASLSKSTLLQAAVAFWTVSDNLLHNRISPPLGNNSGFLCVDLHLPTDIDALADLVRSGAHVSIFCEEIATYTDNKRKEPPCLLHPKMLLFWSTDGTSELWVGSHNWTNRAILGLNVEASVVIRMKTTSPLFYEAAGYLQRVKGICEEFDLSKIELYKKLQRNINQRAVPVIEVRADQADQLAGMEITIFGDDLSDLDELGRFGREVFLSAAETLSSVSEHVYPAEIRQSGALNSGNPSAGSLFFTPRRHAFRIGRRLPELLPYGDIDSSSQMNARYFVTLQLQQEIPHIEFASPVSRTVSWEAADMDASPLIRRLGNDERALLFRGREPRLRRPSVLEPQSALGLTLYEQRTSPERSFLTKRVIREKE
jgi:hypothetical protein